MLSHTDGFDSHFLQKLFVISLNTTTNASANAADIIQIMQSVRNSIAVQKHITYKNHRRFGTAALVLSVCALALLVALAGTGGVLASPADQPNEIEDWYDLNDIRFAWDESYVLVNDLNESTPGYAEVASSDANDGAGFDRIVSFEGELDGQGYEISGLYIAEGDNHVGLFERVSGGTVSDLYLNVEVEVEDAELVGGLAGHVNAGEITNVHVAGNVSGGERVGGLIGQNRGVIERSSSSATVTGESSVGGLVGMNNDASGEEDAVVTRSHASGHVDGGIEGAHVGGLIGFNSDYVSRSYATGSVSGYRGIGGLSGMNTGFIENAYATGDVTGVSHNVGGLVGQNGFSISNGSLSHTYAAGAVSGDDRTGGVIGWQGTEGSSANFSYWDTDATGQDVAVGDDSGATNEIEGLSTVDMHGSVALEHMDAFDFDEVWEAVPDAYPTLRDDPVDEVFFALTIDAEASEFTAVTGENVSAVVAVENTGDKAGVGVVRAFVDSDERATAEVDLDVGETTTIEMTVSVEVDDNALVLQSFDATDKSLDTESVEISVEPPADSGLVDYVDSDGIVDTAALRDAVDDWRSGTIETQLLRDVVDFWRSGEPVDVGDPAFFTVAIDHEASDLLALDGENVTAVVEVSNVGEQAGTTDVTVSVDDEKRAFEGVSLEANESTAVELAVPVAVGDAVATIATADVSEDVAITVAEGEATYELSLVDHDPVLRPGDTLDVPIDVSNTGAEADTQTIELRTQAGDVLDSVEVSLAGGETEAVEFHWVTDEDDAGTHDLAVRSDDETLPVSAAVLHGEVGYADIDVGHVEADLGSIVTVSAVVSNDHDDIASAYEAPVVLGSTVVKTVEGEVAPGESAVLTVALPMDHWGSVDLRIGDAEPVEMHVEKSWSQFGLGDANTGHSSSVSAPSNAVEARWNASIDASMTDPIIVDELVYVGTDTGSIIAVDAEAGDVEWEADVGADVTATPAVAGELLYAGTEDGVTGVDAGSGDIDWTATVDGAATGLASSHDTLYVSTAAEGHGNVYAFDLLTQEELWNVSLAGEPHAAPALVGDRLYVGVESTSGTVYALNATRAAIEDADRLRWSTQTDGAIVGAPAYHNGSLLVGTAGEDAEVLSLDIGAEGTLEWQASTSDDVLGSPAVADGIVYVSQADGEVRALDAADGGIVWTFHTTGTTLQGSPAVASGLVLVGTEDVVKDPRVVAIDAADGTEAWHHAVAGDIRTSAAILEGTVYVASDSVGLLAFEAQTDGGILQISQMSVSETEVTEGDEVDVNLTVTNTGTETETFEIQMDCQIEDVLVDCGVWVVDIEPNEIVHIAGPAPLSQRGEWFLIVDGSSGPGTPIVARPPGTVNGTVTDATTGEPVADTTVHLQVGWDDARVTRETVTTDADGYYELENVTARTYILSYAHDEYVTEDVSPVRVEPSETTTVNVSLEELVWVSGEVFLPDGTPAANHTVSLDEMIKEDPSVTDRTVTRSDGSFELGVPRNETYALVVTEQNYPARDVQYFPQNAVADLFADQAVDLWGVEPGSEFEVGEIHTPEGYNVNVTVVDAVGEGVVGADIVWRDMTKYPETFGDFLWIGTNFDGKPGESFDDPGVELPAGGTAEIVVTAPWGERVNKTVELNGDTDVMAKPDPELANQSKFEVEGIEVAQPALAGDTVTINATFRNIGTISGTQTVQLGITDRDVGAETDLSLQSGQNATVTLEWETDVDDVGTHAIVAESANDSAVQTVELIAADQPYFFIEYEWAELVEEGESMDLFVAVENRGQVGGVQDIVMRIEDDVVDVEPKISLGPGDRMRVRLAWATAVSDAGLHNVTVASDDHAPRDLVEVLGPPRPVFDVEITDTNAPAEVGERMSVNATVLNVGREAGTQEIVLQDRDDNVLDSVTVSLDASQVRVPEELTFSWLPESNDIGVHDLTVASENVSDTVSVEVLDPHPTIQIEDWFDLDAVRDDPDANYVLANDLNESTPGYDEVASASANDGLGFEPLPPVLGFDGNGYAIHGLVIDRPDDAGGSGLFELLDEDSEVTDVHLVGVDITAWERPAGIAGNNWGGTIANVSVTGSIEATGWQAGGIVAIHGESGMGGVIDGAVFNGTVRAQGEVGGIAGVQDSGTIANVTVDGLVEGEGGVTSLNGGEIRNARMLATVESDALAGGIAGRNFGTISTSYSQGTVIGDENVGGIVGEAWSDSAVVETYVAGAVIGNDTVGGLVGENAHVGFGGDLEGYGTLENSYWDVDVTGQPEAVGNGSEGIEDEVEGLTTDEMTDNTASNHLTGFDFENVWKVQTEDYPALQTNSAG